MWIDFALGVVVEAGEADEGLVAGAGGWDDILDEERPRSDPDESPTRQRDRGRN